jgi:hypothetical protein
MHKKFSETLDRIANYLAARKGMLPIIGIIFIVLNLVIKLLLPGWLADTDLFLHMGIILAIFGFMLAWAL